MQEFKHSGPTLMNDLAAEVDRWVRNIGRTGLLRLVGSRDYELGSRIKEMLDRNGIVSNLVYVNSDMHFDHELRLGSGDVGKATWALLVSVRR